jgi:hypothetical protein
MMPGDGDHDAVLARYPEFDDKGPEVGGYRLTLLSAGLAVETGQAVRIVHVCESTSTGAPLYVMGPKTILGEFVDEELASPPVPAGEDPVAPSAYDGRVLPGPGIDANYEITEYVFDTAGRHTVQWRLGEHISNMLQFDVS